MAWLNHFPRETPGSQYFFERNGQRDAIGCGASEGVTQWLLRALRVDLPLLVCMAGTVLGARGDPHKQLLGDPALGT